MEQKINSLLNASKQVILDCALPNGAIVAANSTKPYFPKGAKYYKFVWPRDALYICSAARILKINNIQEKFFDWCMRAEDWDKTGLFYEKYFINGKKARHNFQPDQTGSVLIALYEQFKDDKNKAKKYEKLITKSADALCRIWKKDHFTIVTQDLWEEKFCFPDLLENFSYSLAICARGLNCANKLIANKTWLKVSSEMTNTLLKKNNSNNHFSTSFGKINDDRVDASLLGLVWPAGIVCSKDAKMKNTVKLIEDKIVKANGVYRYENDAYDGWMYNDVNRKKGAGYWPLLNFWMTLYFIDAGNKKKALLYYNKVLDDMKNKKYIPEQIFNNNIQIAVSPLCWSHSMFVIATEKLNFIKK